MIREICKRIYKLITGLSFFMPINFNTYVVSNTTKGGCHDLSGIVNAMDPLITHSKFLNFRVLRKNSDLVVNQP